jgi:hypothetical protein
VFSYRVITGAILVAGSVFASGLFAGGALAQYEPVGKPLQLVPPTYSSKSAATPRSRVSAKKAAKSETKSEAKSASAQSEVKAETKAETKQHVSFRRKHRPHTEMAEQKRPQRTAMAAGGDVPAAQVAAKPTAPLRTPAAPSAASLSAPSAATPAPAAQAASPAPPTTGELVIDGQAVQVRSPDEANELDLAANAPSAPAAASVKPTASSDSASLYNLAGPSPAAASEAAPAASAAPSGSVPPAAVAALAAEMDSAKAEVAPPKSTIGSASWIMQIMAALGGAAAAGSAAWFLIGSASPRIKLSEWQEADEEG